MKKRRSIRRKRSSRDLASLKARARAIHAKAAHHARRAKASAAGHYAKAKSGVKGLQEKAKGLHAKAKSLTKSSKYFYTLMFEGEKGDRDRKLKGYAGPFSTKAEADQAAHKEKTSGWREPRVVYLTKPQFQQVWSASGYEAEDVLHSIWKRETGYVASDVSRRRVPKRRRIVRRRA